MARRSRAVHEPAPRRRRAARGPASGDSGAGAPRRLSRRRPSPISRGDRFPSPPGAIPAPEPPPDSLAGARRRYREAIDARHRREIYASLASGLLGLGLIVFLL